MKSTAPGTVVPASHRSGLKPKAEELEDHKQHRDVDWQEISILPCIKHHPTTCLEPAHADTLQ